MKISFGLYALVLALPLLFLLGCHDPVSSKQQAETDVQKNLARLSPEDRRLAEEQGFCAVETDSKLGSMGTPYKVMVKDQPVFLCCEGCKKKALKDPDATLAQVKKLRAQTAAAKTK